MKLQLDVLAQNLRDAEPAKTFTMQPINEYVLRRIYEPLHRDDPVYFSKLDFSAFSEEDLTDLKRLLSACESMKSDLSNINYKLCCAHAVSITKPRFC